MSDEVKMGFDTGLSLVFTCFEPDGTGRGLADQPLFEIRPTGYYRATPLTALEAGDIVLGYILENVYWEDSLVVVLAYEYVFWEGELVHYEERWVTDFDTESLARVTWTGKPIGVGEYQPDIVSTAIDADLTVLQASVDDLIVDQNKVLNIYDEREAPQAAQVIVE